MLQRLQFTLFALFATADVRSRHWYLVRSLRRRPSIERLEEAILYRHRLRHIMEEFLDSDDARLQDLALTTLWPMLDRLNRAIPEAEDRLED